MPAEPASTCLVKKLCFPVYTFESKTTKLLFVWFTSTRETAEQNGRLQGKMAANICRALWRVSQGLGRWMDAEEGSAGFHARDDNKLWGWDLDHLHIDHLEKHDKSVQGNLRHTSTSSTTPNIKKNGLCHFKCHFLWLLLAKVPVFRNQKNGLFWYDMTLSLSLT